MIPQAWIDERIALRLLYCAQAREGYVLAEGEAEITDKDFAALDARLVIADDLTQLQTGDPPRGQYALGDTQGFVLAEEDKCQRYNCWMVRGAKGEPQYLSEHPDAILARGEAVPLPPVLPS
jgi:hypothetical protein